MIAGASAAHREPETIESLPRQRQKRAQSRQRKGRGASLSGLFLKRGATMKNFDATRSNDAPLHCYYCGRAIAGGNWFARVKLGGGRVAFCRPGCVELFLDCPDRCEGSNARSGSIGPPETAGAYSWQPAQAAPANWDRAAGNRPMATAPMRLVNS